MYSDLLKHWTQTDMLKLRCMNDGDVKQTVTTLDRWLIENANAVDCRLSDVVSIKFKPSSSLYPRVTSEELELKTMFIFCHSCSMVILCTQEPEAIQREFNADSDWL